MAMLAAVVRGSWHFNRRMCCVWSGLIEVLFVCLETKEVDSNAMGR
jgi:hypothetical protein